MRRRQEKNTAYQDRIIQEGKDAAAAGKTKADCPYQMNLMARSAWLVGWELYQRQQKASDRPSQGESK